MSELELMTTEQLLEELGRRYPVMVFGGIREYPGDRKSDDCLCHHNGNAALGLGVCEMVRRYLHTMFGLVEGASEDQ